MKIEIKEQADKTFVLTGRIGSVMLTPDLGEGYWKYRVHLFKDQYLLAFPKFGTIGIGFAIEDEDWNTNLPYTSSSESIASHIIHHHKYPEITKSMVIEAIELLQKTISEERR